MGAIVVLFIPIAATSVIVIAVAALAGALLAPPGLAALSDLGAPPTGKPHRAALITLIVFAGLLVALPMLVAITRDPALDLIDRF